MQALSSHYEIYKRVCFYTRLWSQSSFLLSAPGAATMTFSGVVSRNTSPTASLPSAVTSLNATGTTLGAPLAQVASVCPICQEALSDEESAEAPPAAEEARRFRGSVLTAGRGSGWEPADTTVSAEEHAKKSPPKWVVIYGAGDEESAEAPPAAEEARRFRGSVPTAGRGSGWEPADTTVSAEEHAKKSPPKWVVIYVITHRFCCSHPRISQGRGSVRGKPLRVSPLAFNHPPAGDRFCAAKSPLQKKRPPFGWSHFFGAGDEARTRFPASHEWLSPFAGALPHLLI